MGEGASPALGPPRPPPHGRGDVLRFGATEAPAAWARGPPPLGDHRGPRRVSAGVSSACAVGAGAQPGLRPSAVFNSESSTVAIHTYSSSGAFPVGQAPGESVSWSAHGHLRQECCAVGGGGGSGYGPSPRDLPAKCRPVGSTWRAKGLHP